MNLMVKALNDGILRLFNMPRLSLPLIVTLGLTLGAVLCLVTISSALIFKPIPGVKNLQTIKRFDYTITIGNGISNSHMSMRRLAHLQKHFKDAGTWAGLSPGKNQARVNNSDYAVTSYNASDNILEVLGTSLITGESVKGNEFDNRVWISNSMWQQAYLAREDIIGQSIEINEQTYLIAGVIEDLYGMDTNQQILPQQVWHFTNLAKLRGQVEPNSAPSDVRHLFLLPHSTTAQLPTLADFKQWLRVFIKDYAEQAEGIQRFYDSLTHDLIVEDFRTFMFSGSQDLVVGLLIIVLCLLCIAVLNLLNLFIAFYQERTREFALRISLGAPLKQVRLLVFLENLPTFMLAGSLGLLVGGWLLRSLPQLAKGQLPLLSLIQLDSVTVAAALASILVLNLLFSLFALIDINKQAIAENLSTSGKGSFAQQNQWVKQVLMVLQLALACIVLSIATTVAKSNYNLVYRDLGYTTDNTYQLSMGYTDQKWQQDMSQAEVKPGNEYHQLLSDLGQVIEQTIPDSEIIIPSTGPLSETVSIYAVNAEFNGKEQSIFYQERKLTPEYLKHFNMPLLAGRNLSDETFANHERNVLIDQRMAELLYPEKSYDEVIGQPLPIASTPYNISGIVANSYSMAGTNWSADVPMVYRVFFTPMNELYFTLKLPQGTEVDTEQLSNAISGFEPRLKFTELVSYQTILARQTLRQRMNLWIVLTLTGLTLFLAAIGVAGMTRMSTNHRKYELAIRMATGARQSTLLSFMLKDASKVLLLGLGIGFIFSAIGYTQLQNHWTLLPEMDWTIIITTDIMLTLIVLLAVIIPAWQVIKNEPMRVLREE